MNESRTQFLARIAYFLEAHGRDEGGLSEATRQSFQADADRLREVAGIHPSANTPRCHETRFSTYQGIRQREACSRPAGHAEHHRWYCVNACLHRGCAGQRPRVSAAVPSTGEPNA